MKVVRVITNETKKLMDIVGGIILESEDFNPKIETKTIKTEIGDIPVLRIFTGFPLFDGFPYKWVIIPYVPGCENIKEFEFV